MHVDQIVWQVDISTSPEDFMLRKGVVVECGYWPDDLTLSVQPLSLYHPVVIEHLNESIEHLNDWFETKGGAIMAAKVACRQEAKLVQTSLDDNLSTKLTQLTNLNQGPDK
jgi:hypothetical protein